MTRKNQRRRRQGRKRKKLMDPLSQAIPVLRLQGIIMSYLCDIKRGDWLIAQFGHRLLLGQFCGQSYNLPPLVLFDDGKSHMLCDRAEMQIYCAKCDKLPLENASAYRSNCSCIPKFVSYLYCFLSVFESCRDV